MNTYKNLLREKAAQIQPAEKRLFDHTDDIAARIVQLPDERGMTQTNWPTLRARGKRTSVACSAAASTSR